MSPYIRYHQPVLHYVLWMGKTSKLLSGQKPSLQAANHSSNASHGRTSPVECSNPGRTTSQYVKPNRTRIKQENLYSGKSRGRGCKSSRTNCNVQKPTASATELMSNGRTTAEQIQVKQFWQRRKKSFETDRNSLACHRIPHKYTETKGKWKGKKINPENLQSFQ